MPQIAPLRRPPLLVASSSRPPGKPGGQENAPLLRHKPWIEAEGEGAEGESHPPVAKTRLLLSHEVGEEPTKEAEGDSGSLRLEMRRIPHLGVENPRTVGRTLSRP